MAIVLDGEVLSAPVIQAELPTGGVITGDFTQEEAETLALQLRSGSLRLPLSVESTQQVGATLGQTSVALSIQAGIIGVIIVLAFMIIYYRALGAAAAMALLVFIVLNLALFKMIPVTLTLPAIAGFLISIGTAVDGNILIFERIKEEVRDGQRLSDALVAGFDRAWASIRDSNISTIIICGILFLFGQTPGASIVSAFAVTLALGLTLNLFTAIVVTRTFLSVIVNWQYDYIEEHAWTLGV
jgi:protein-export membrane protein SecD